MADAGSSLGETFSRTVFETAPCLLVLLDRRGRIIRFNRACCELTGYAPDEVLDHTVWEFLLPPEQRVGVEGVFESLIAELHTTDDRQRYPYSYENEWVAKDGRRRSILWSNACVRTEQGDVAAVLGAGLDITERRDVEHALRESEGRYRLLVDHASVCIKEIDRQGRVVGINAAGVRMLGAARASDVIGRRFVECTSAEDSVLVGRQIARAFEGHSAEFEFTALCLGTPLVLSSTLIPVKGSSGAVDRVVSVTQNITERKRAQAQLIEQRSLVRLGQMTAVVAHEVRNPLAGISSVLQILQRRVPREHPDRALFAQVLSRLDDLRDLTDDLLEFSRPRPLSRTRNTVHKLIEQAAAAVRQDPEFQEIDVRIQGPDVALMLDASRFVAVLQNLILNAAHAMAGVGVVEVVTRLDGDSCQITVTDRGPGIPSDVLEKIFEPFFTTKKRGTGLGLAMASQVVQAHGGTIHASNAAEGGAAFRVVLPTK